MAIDTINEKFALISYHQPWNTPIPISADGLGQDDKQHLLWNYPGLLWSESGAGTRRSYFTGISSRIFGRVN